MKIGNYEFQGPFQLQNWNAPRNAGVYAILHENLSNNYNVDYIGESENLMDRGFPWNHHKSRCWIGSAGSATNVYVAVHNMSGSTAQQRRAIESQLIGQFNPPCNG